jgi:hypothetical protein
MFIVRGESGALRLRDGKLNAKGKVWRADHCVSKGLLRGIRYAD